MKETLRQFEQRAPEIVFEWNDAPTGARGWVVINSLRGGAAGGGTRMRKGLDRREVESLAKTMEVKFTVSGPAIGGAKSGIDFDPTDPRKQAVLDRWYKAVMPLLKAYYGTGGDMNVDEVHEVIPITERYGLRHPQEGVVNGHIGGHEGMKLQAIQQLRTGVSKVVNDTAFVPVPGKYAVADMITGWGVSESVRHYYGIYGGELMGKRVIVQGWGNVGAAAGYYLSQQGARIVGIIDRHGGALITEGFTTEQVRDLFVDKAGNTLRAQDMLPFDEVDARIWDIGAEVFMPCAASRLVTKHQVDRMVAADLEVIASGANVPFADPEIFYGPIAEHADGRVSVIPDFIANCGMARVFAYCMMDGAQLTDQAIFGDVSERIADALRRTHAHHPGRTHLTRTAFDIALEQLT
ncbi:MAG: amino acid dehydrogenase [Flavobacteriales bacterium]|nr:amino acid dehydrogenase [Flavobacteriales bacterium]MBK7942411.1 amino acid dehydrogenase [Flavobacteriales bacterium]MBK8948227.1 amino acid dehydrogenase [Flavobacteriales bacterium]MBK9699187.1 amino acid dehydrogenase [Flavobacteriales bacterium]